MSDLKQNGITDRQLELQQQLDAIATLASIQREIDFARKAGDGAPEWWGDRHDTGLIFGIQAAVAQATHIAEQVFEEANS